MLWMAKIYSVSCGVQKMYHNTYLYIHNIPKWMDNLISHAPNYPDKLHTLIPHLWEYQKYTVFSLQRSLPSSSFPKPLQKRHLFGERCITHLEEKCFKRNVGNVLKHVRMIKHIYIYIMTHIYDICCPSEVYTLILWHILFGCKALIGNLKNHLHGAIVYLPTWMVDVDGKCR